MNIRSIRFRLLAAGVLAVLTPLVIVGIIAVVKATHVATTLSKETAGSTSSHVADLVEDNLQAQARLAQAYASDELVRITGMAVRDRGIAGAAAEVAQLRQEMKRKFKDLGGGYLGIFVTDREGELYTGELANGDEYKGSNVASRDYFQEAKSSGKAVVGDIVKSKSTGALIYVACAPVYDDAGEFLGTFGMSAKAETLTEIVSLVKVGSTGYAFMANRDGIIIAHPNQEFVLSLDLKTLKGMEAITKGMMAGEKGVLNYVFKEVPKIAGFAPVASKGWSVALTQNEEEFLSASTTIRNSIILVAGLTMLLVLAAFYFIARGIVNPINRAVAGLKDIAEGEGDLTKRLEITSRDEVGELARWLNVFMEKLQGIIGNIAGNTEAVDRSSNQLLEVASNLSQGAGDTARQAESVAAATEEMNVNISNVAAAMEESTTNVSMVASAAEEMSSTINEIAQNAEQANSITSSAVEQSAKTATRMNELGVAAQAIGKVTEAITEISEQTNLLALNATIEAARAGEAGKGFAVVANEIKELAKQTAAATLNIKEQIAGVQKTTSETVGEIDTISRIINQVNEIVATIAGAVTQQSAATQEIANNISQASQGLQEVNENVNQSSAVAMSITQEITGVDAASREIAGNSDEVKTNAEELQRLANSLKSIVNQFKI